ncbi:hypothetical protein [Novosphingobium sp.]|uniref:hypothetical protein n=1 Tax=Novosphingobium sp. TaxID=1874826 RepID=UPI002734C1F6|nr:hypothetical protein [Novosphingobium sp.]MDP3905627.1 hypothetical protein [Novosphingobium sp.]
MDLNSLYSSHQVALMRAAASGCRSLGGVHLAAAEALAARIACFQDRLGASASTGWAAIAAPAGCECAA